MARSSKFSVGTALLVLPLAAFLLMILCISGFAVTDARMEDFQLFHDLCFDIGLALFVLTPIPAIVCAIIGANLVRKGALTEKKPVWPMIIATIDIAFATVCLFIIWYLLFVVKVMLQ